VFILAVFAAPARAGCADPISNLGQRSSVGRSALRLPAPALAFQSGTPGRVDDGNPTIVGLWQVTFTSAGNDVDPLFIPDGVPLDQGYAQWHSDGTELMNSSRDPATGNFCMGVWVSSGPRTYRLNHVALSWDNTGKFCTPPAGSPSCFVGPANIREQVTVDPHGDTYTGWVTITQYNTSDQAMFTLKGDVAARRITAN